MRDTTVNFNHVLLYFMKCIASTFDNYYEPVLLYSMKRIALTYDNHPQAHSLTAY